jgi:hypothetical protein
MEVHQIIEAETKATQATRKIDPGSPRTALRVNPKQVLLSMNIVST